MIATATKQQGRGWAVALATFHPLVLFRVFFGVLMLASTLRFVANGWVESLIIAPRFHFHYWGFAWIHPLPEAWMMYAVYGVMGSCAVGIAVGAWYRLSVAGFLLTFTYTELIDKTYYLNHYYFIILLAVLMVFLPLANEWSWDAYRSNRPSAAIPAWAIHILRLQMALVWFFAGVAKLNPDWLLRAQPLQLWLAARHDYPFIGWLLDIPATAYAMSWAGALYDLTIAFWLLWKPTRRWAFLAVVAFHTLTAILFPTIGMFPYIMLVCTVVFLDNPHPKPETEFLPFFPSKTRFLSSLFRLKQSFSKGSMTTFTGLFVVSFFLIQVFLPLRHWLYPGDVLWTEEGYRFSWRVMLVEKSGDVTFTLRDPATGAEWQVFPDDYLTPLQEKQMAFQPDMILEFAHYLAEEARREGMAGVEVRAEAWVAFNGRPSRLLIDPTIDLAQEKWDLRPKDWILR
jgi:hypothetical protein